MSGALPARVAACVRLACRRARVPLTTRRGLPFADSGELLEYTSKNMAEGLRTEDVSRIAYQVRHCSEPNMLWWPTVVGLGCPG